jgi:hypothetical protein
MTARKASRHRAILRDQKFPPEYKAMYHKEASEAIASCVASNFENISSLDRATAVLEQINPEKIGTQRRVVANINAIERFKLMLDGLDLGSATPMLGENSPPKLRIQNVDISVRPEILLSGKGKKDSKLVGAMKLHFSTTNPLNEEAGSYVSAILQEWSKAYLPDGETYGPYCYVIDVGSGKSYKGIKATTARMKDVESACRNIVLLWPDISEDE